MRDHILGDSDFGVNLPDLLLFTFSTLLWTSGQVVRKSSAFVPVASAQFAGEDPVVALEAALQFEDTRESMHAFCVGQYLEVRFHVVSTGGVMGPSLYL